MNAAPVGIVPTSRTGTLALAAVVVVLLATAAGCMPWPRTQFVPRVPVQQLVGSGCALNAHVPVGARLPLGRATAIVRVGEHQGRGFVELQLDVPAGTTLRLEDAAIALRAPAPAAVSTARFTAISLVDAPIVNHFSPVAAVRALQRPVDTPMVGGEIAAGASASARHYWLAAYIDLPLAPAFELELPALRAQDGSVHRLRLGFEARTVMAVAVINC